MREKYLGDSYDLVKRFWAENLRSVAPLYAHPFFIPDDLRRQFEAVTKVRVVNLDNPPSRFGLLLDPDVGIPLAGSPKKASTVSHVLLSFIIDTTKSLRPRYIVCFDQSVHRGHKLKAEQQRTSKRDYLQRSRLHSFYYVSHAPFLFVSPHRSVLRAVFEALLALGIPRECLEPIDLFRNPRRQAT